MNYKIEIKSPYKQAKRSSFLFLSGSFVLAGVGALTVLLGRSDTISKTFHAPLMGADLLGGFLSAFGLTQLVYLFFNLKKLRKSEKLFTTLRWLHLIVSAGAAIIFLFAQWWLAGGITACLALANLFAAFTERSMKKSLFVVFSDEAITLPASSRKGMLQWQDAERVLLRHGNITIDCADNYLYQWTIVRNDVDADAFEAFCAAQIQAAKHKRKAHWSDSPNS